MREHLLNSSKAQHRHTRLAIHVPDIDELCVACAVRTNWSSASANVRVDTNVTFSRHATSTDKFVCRTA